MQQGVSGRIMGGPPLHFGYQITDRLFALCKMEQWSQWITIL